MSAICGKMMLNLNFLMLNGNCQEVSLKPIFEFLNVPNNAVS